MKYFCLERHQFGMTMPAALVLVEDTQGANEAMGKAISHIEKWHKGGNLNRKKDRGNEIVDIFNKDERYPPPRYVIKSIPLTVLD